MKERLRNLLNEAMDKNGIYLDEITAFLIENNVIPLPCKVGDTVYDISEFFDGTHCPEMYEYKINNIQIEELNQESILYIEDLKYPDEAWGKVLFFSREEAEQTLRKEQNNG